MGDKQREQIAHSGVCGCYAHGEANNRDVFMCLFPFMLLLRDLPVRSFWEFFRIGKKCEDVLGELARKIAA